MATYSNITGELTQELIAAGAGQSITSISLVNIEGSNPCTVDLYIEKALVGKFYLIKDMVLPIGSVLKHNLNFNNDTDEYGLYIKLTKTAAETPAVDVIIN